MEWLVIIAPGPIDERDSRQLISNLPPGAKHVVMGSDALQLTSVQIPVEAPSEAEARAIALAIFNEAATGLGLHPRIQHVTKPAT